MSYEDQFSHTEQPKAEYVRPDNLLEIYSRPSAAETNCGEQNRKLVAQLAKLIAQPNVKLKILDVGCSDGSATVILAKNLIAAGYPRKSFEIIGIDAREEAVAHACREGNSPRISEISFLTHDLFKESFEGKFEIIYCNHVLKAISPEYRQHVLNNILSSLSSGGIITFEDKYDPDPYDDPYSFGDMDMRQQEFNRWFDETIESIPYLRRIKNIGGENGRYFRYVPAE
jgi:2-polyprenyl-3-methyl-5-hydroxy-6-metoxy-1,4-benzoquinol methylase